MYSHYRINRDIARARYSSSNFWHWLGGSSQMLQLGAVLEQAGVTGTHMNNWTSRVFSDSGWFICRLRPGWGRANYFKTLDHSFAGISPPPDLSLRHHLWSVFTVPRLVCLRAYCGIDHAAKVLLTDPRPGVRANKVRNDNRIERSRGAWGVRSDLSWLLVFALQDHPIYCSSGDSGERS